MVGQTTDRFPDAIDCPSRRLRIVLGNTIADLLEQWADQSLVVDALRHAAEQGKLLSPRRLAEFLEPIAAAHGAASGGEFAAQLMEEAGLVTGATPRG